MPKLRARTVTLHSAEISVFLILAVMIAVPGDFAVTLPTASTVATFSSDERNSISEVMFSVAVAVSFFDVLLYILIFSKSSEMLTSTLSNESPQRAHLPEKVLPLSYSHLPKV